MVKFRFDPAVSGHDSTLMISRKTWRRKNGKFVMTGVVENGGWNLTYRDGLMITGRGDPGNKAQLIEMVRVPEYIPVEGNNWDDAFDWFHDLPQSQKSVSPALAGSAYVFQKVPPCPTCGR